jgi:hypothetical protein
MVEHQTMSGVLTIVVRDRQGRMLEERRVHNVITNQGREMVGRLFSQPKVTVTALAITVGEGATKEAATDTGLAKPVATAPATAAPAQNKQANVIAVAAKLPAISDPNARRELTEAGIVVTVQAGEQSQDYLYNRVTFPVVTQTSSTDISLSWEVTF